MLEQPRFVECFSSEEVVREYGLAVYQARLRAVQRVVWEFTIVRAFGYMFLCIPAADPLNQYSLEVLGLKINVMCNLKGELLTIVRSNTKCLWFGGCK